MRISGSLIVTGRRNLVLAARKVLVFKASWILRKLLYINSLELKNHKKIIAFALNNMV